LGSGGGIVIYGSRASTRQAQTIHGAGAHADSVPNARDQEVLMPALRLKQYLDSNAIRYVNVTHSLAYTAQEIASIAHVPGRDLAKTVMVFVDDKLAMAVLPANRHVSLGRLQALTGAKTIRLASEAEFRAAFPDCETGAMPPFGNLYDLPVYVDLSVRHEEIIFNAGTHRELVRMAYADFARLVKPLVGDFAAEARQVAAF
jgi:Ala-tRNA(Pro) deacylase